MKERVSLKDLITVLLVALGEDEDDESSLWMGRSVGGGAGVEVVAEVEVVVDEPDRTGLRLARM